MPKLKPATHSARRAHILDAAEQCFAAQGFHRTTMQDICKGAGVSSGAVYVYFKSKEDLIAGICERDRAKLAGEFAAMAEAPDLLAALGQLAQHYAVEQPAYKRVLVIEMGLESTRNPGVAAFFQATDRFCVESFTRLFERARHEGKIAPRVDVQTLAQVIATIGDGIFWRRAIEPNHDPRRVIDTFLDLVSTLINPIQPLGHAAPTAPPKPTKALT